MRKFFAGVVALAFHVMAHATSPSAGPATFQFNAATQATLFHQVSSKTNITATATNVIVVDGDSFASTPFVNSNLLSLLADSFNTNFPAGSRIGYSFGQFVVVDRTGTNIFNVSSVLKIIFDGGVYSLKQTEINSQNQNGLSVSGNKTQTFFNIDTISYDDSALTPRDGVHSAFQLRGVSVETVSTNLKTLSQKIKYEFQGSGSGMVHGVTTILGGTIKAAAADAL